MRKVGIKGILLVVAYAITYVFLREISVSTWLLPAGLRFVAFLVLPYRAWPAIIVGDCLASAHYRGHMIATFGAPWFAAALAGPVVSSATVAFFLKIFQWPLGVHSFARAVGALLVGAATASIMSAATGIAALALIPHYKPVISWGGVLGAFALGDFLGILMVAPLTLLYLAKKNFPIAIENDRRGLTNSGLLWLLAYYAFLLVVVVTINRSTTEGEVIATTRALLFIPLLIMTIRHGWLGATLSLAMCNLALQATMRDVLAASLVEMQCFIALFGSAMLVGGAMITEFQVRASSLARESHAHLQLARQNLAWGELRARQSATILESAYKVFQQDDDVEIIATGSGASAAVRANQRWIAFGGVRRDLRQAIELLSVRALDTHGLPIALMMGPIAQAMEEAGIRYAVRVSGDTRAIPFDMNMLVYRLISDFSVRLAIKHSARKIRVRLIISPEQRATFAIVVRAITGEGPAPRLPAPYFATNEIRGIATTYRGVFHNHIRRRRPTLAILLRDT